MRGLMMANSVVAGRAEDGWDRNQSELVNAIINVAQQSHLKKRRFWRNSRPKDAGHGKGSDLEKFLPGLQAVRFAASMAGEVRTRCGGVHDLAIVMKRSMQPFSLAGSLRIRSLW